MKSPTDDSLAFLEKMRTLKVIKVLTILPALSVAISIDDKKYGVCSLSSLSEIKEGVSIEEWAINSLKCRYTSREDGLASATYNKTMETIGWDIFTAEINNDALVEDREAATAAAGYLEGSYMAQRISDFVHNQVADYLLPDGSAVDMDQLGPLFDWERRQEAWVLLKVAEAAAASPFSEASLWAEVATLYTQLAGIAVGLQESGVDLYGMTAWRAVMTANLMGEYDDVMLAINKSARPNWKNMTIEEYAVNIIKNDHCSAFVSLGSFNEELYVGHNMWWNFAALMPVFKTYIWGDSTVQMTSFPGAISSVDDYYSLSSSHQKMVVMETTNPIYRSELLDLLHPETLWTWTRVMVANRLAVAGEEWVRIFEKHNSGTYNNMWLVVDYKRFIPYNPILADSGLLWVAEQMPGHVEYHDLSERLSSGFFPSYNQAYFEKTKVISGAHENDLYWRESANVTSQSYQMNSRAFLFREYGHLAQSLDGGKQLLRWNQYQTDPIVLSNPDPLTQSMPSVYGSLASRGDLNPITNPGPVNSVATNAALISLALLNQQQVLVVGGPSHDNQPVFNWSSAPDVIQAVAHQGAPDAWGFDWMAMSIKPLI